jgi:branched-chain amino acid aminotransferase
MSAYIRLLTPDGVLHPVTYIAENLADAAKHEPSDGVYTITNTYHISQVLKMDDHLNRLEDSARRADIPLRLDRPMLRKALRACILDYGVGDVRWRVTVGKARPQDLIITLEAFIPTALHIYDNGVRVITAPDSARHNAAAKTTLWMTQREALVKAMPVGIYDTILQDEDGNLLEGLAANFYAIKDGRLWTADENVLPGISRLIVFEVAPLVLPLVRQPINVTEIPVLSEAFITSASRGIVPVVEIDGYVLGDGKPGAMTRQLREAYLAWVQAHLEEI